VHNVHAEKIDMEVRDSTVSITCDK